MKKNLRNLIPMLSEGKVLCIGDPILDHFVEGQASRISAEAPVPVLIVKEETHMGGGAANVIRNLSSLGTKSGYIGIVGTDSVGDRLRMLMETHNPKIDYHWVVDSERKTPLKSRYGASGQQMIRIDYEEFSCLSKKTEQNFLNQLEKIIADYSVLLISDNRTGAFSDAIIQESIKMAVNFQIPVLADSKRRDYSVFCHADMVKPNRLELSRATGLPTDSDAEITKAARHLISTHKIKSALVTRSEQGMSYITPEEENHISTSIRTVYDVAGAGDTVMAVMALCTAIDIDPIFASHMANIAAGIVVTKRGTSTVSKDEMLNSLQRRPPYRINDKIFNQKEMHNNIEKWRSYGFKVGFTNGCFDLFHIGHACLLEKARHHCDYLIVAINSDASVSNLKGPGRPMHNQLSRARLIAGLGHVDAVIIFDEESPKNLINAFKPDVVIKGGDYNEKGLPEAETIRSYGGEMRFIELEPGISTSSMIEKIQKGRKKQVSG